MNLPYDKDLLNTIFSFVITYIFKMNMQYDKDLLNTIFSFLIPYIFKINLQYDKDLLNTIFSFPIPYVFQDEFAVWQGPLKHHIWFIPVLTGLVSFTAGLPRASNGGTRERVLRRYSLEHHNTSPKSSEDKSTMVENNLY